MRVDASMRDARRGRIRVEGSAPDNLVWELGCRPGRPPLMRLRGGVYLQGGYAG